jgi:EmrB/QacA subfamily drug resistance transporter
MQNRSVALAAAAMSSFLVPFMMSAVGITLPAIQNALSATAVELSWVEGGYMLSLAVILLPLGRLADILGRRRTFVWGTAWFTVATLLVSLAWSIQALLVLRVLQGMGAAMINSTGVAIVTSTYPPKERGRAMGIIVGCVYAGLSVGPLMGGLMTDWAGWRAVFYLSIVPGFLAWVLACRIDQEWRPSRGEHFDLFGAVLYGAFVVSFVKGLTGLARPGTGVFLLALAFLMALLFFRRSRRIEHPVLSFRLFTDNRVFTLSSLATTINYAGTFAVGFLLSLYLQVVKGFPPVHAGLILVIQPATQALLSPVAGMLSDRVNAAGMATFGMGLCGAGLFGLGQMGAESPVWLIAGLLMLMGLGFALFASPNMSVIMGSVAPKDYSIASSLVATMRTFGMSLSMGIATVVFGFLLHGRQVSVESIPQFLASMRIIFAVCAGLCVAGVFCSMGRVRRH